MRQLVEKLQLQEHLSLEETLGLLHHVDVVEVLLQVHNSQEETLGLLPTVDYNPGEEAGFRPGLEGKGDTSSTYQKKGLIIYKSNFSIDYLRKLQKLDVLLKYLRTTSHEGHVQL